jgi:hypothetical protein
MGVTVAVVHQGSEAEAGPFFADRGLADVARVSDPDRQLYRAFHLGRGGLREILAPSVVGRSARSVLAGNGFGRPVGDARQMPGVFTVRRGVVLEEFRHRAIADRPDYVAMARRAAAARE